MNYCTYLTTYLGNKLPPFYLGSTNLDKISKGYRGSVSSLQYKDVWKSELKTQPELFKITPLTIHLTRTEAFNKERQFQLALNVINNPLYMNMSIGHNKFYHGNHNLTTRLKMSKTRKGKSKSLHHIESMRVARIGKPHPQKLYTCEYCGLKTIKVNIVRHIPKCSIFSL